MGSDRATRGTAGVRRVPRLAVRDGVRPDAGGGAGVGVRDRGGGSSLPGVSALRRAVDGSLVPTGRAEFGPGDDFCAVWPLFDLLEGGAGDWAPQV
jgi:hypothetical protein